MRAFQALITLASILGSECLPQTGQYFLLPPSSQLLQQPLHPSLGQVLLYKDNLAAQGSPYLAAQNRPVFVNDGLDAATRAGFFNPAQPYRDDDASVQEMQPPAAPKFNLIGSEPVPFKGQSDDAEAKTRESEGSHSKLEEFEPDAELIPDSVMNSNPQAQPQPQPQPQPQNPFYPVSPGLIPGRTFYVYNSIPQYYPGFPQVTTALQPQPTFKYPSVFNSYPQQFIIYRQPTVETTYQPQSPVLLYNDPASALLRKSQLQHLRVPPLFSLFKSTNQEKSPIDTNEISNDDKKTEIPKEAEKTTESTKPDEVFMQFIEQTGAEVVDRFAKSEKDDNDSVTIEAADATTVKNEIAPKELKSDVEIKLPPRIVVSNKEAKSSSDNKEKDTISDSAAIALASSRR